MTTLWTRLISCVLFILSFTGTGCGEEPTSLDEPEQEAEAASPSPAREALLWDGVEGRLRRVSYVDVDDMAVHGGDIILGSLTEVASQTRALEAADGTDLRALGAGIYRSRLWPNAVVPYVIASNLPAPARVKTAIAQWESKTHVNFVLRTSQNAHKYPNYISFRRISGSTSFSKLGMTGGRQYVDLADAADVSVVLHEIGHAVGFFHEHQRFDRNEHVRINLQCVVPGLEYAFDREASKDTYVSTYDPASIMHYSSYSAATWWGCPTIVKKDGSLIPDQPGLSAKDVASFKRLYRP